MLISDENSRPVLLKSIEEPVASEYFWVLNLNERDFELAPLVMLEEITTPVLKFSVGKVQFTVPTDWNILIYSPETSQIDIVEVSELTRGDYSAFLMDHKLNRVTKNTINVIDYSSVGTVHVPTMNKNVMLCHAAGPSHWICLAPTDNYNKLLKECAVGDILP